MEVIKPDLFKATAALKRGLVLVCPTDTVYGLVCDAADKKAVKKIYKIKKRPENKPLPIFINNVIMAKKIAKIGKLQGKFLKEVWPGKITVVLNAKKGGTIGLRVPNSKFILDLVKRTGPLAETSANISGEPATTRIRKALGQFQNQKHQPDLVINAGNLQPSRPSMVIDLTIWPPKILRP